MSSKDPSNQFPEGPNQDPESKFFDAENSRNSHFKLGNGTLFGRNWGNSGPRNPSTLEEYEQIRRAEQLRLENNDNKKKKPSRPVDESKLPYKDRKGFPK